MGALEMGEGGRWRGAGRSQGNHPQGPGHQRPCGAVWPSSSLCSQPSPLVATTAPLVSQLRVTRQLSLGSFRAWPGSGSWLLLDPGYCFVPTTPLTPLHGSFLHLSSDAPPECAAWIRAALLEQSWDSLVTSPACCCAVPTTCEMH